MSIDKIIEDLAPKPSDVSREIEKRIEDLIGHYQVKREVYEFIMDNLADRFDPEQSLNIAVWVQKIASSYARLAWAKVVGNDDLAASTRFIINNQEAVFAIESERVREPLVKMSREIGLKSLQTVLIAFAPSLGLTSAVTAILSEVLEGYIEQEPENKSV